MPVAAVLRASLAAGAVDQDPPHGLGRGGEEVAAAVPVPGSLSASDQPEVRLVDQGRGLERLAGLLLRQLLGGQLAQLVVDQRQELLGRLRVALLDGREDAGDVVHAGRCPGPSGRVATRTDAGATTLRLDSDEADRGAEVRSPG